MSAPRVSVLMPAYQAEQHIEESLRSVLSQSFDDLELIVVDDGSTDRTAAVVEACTDPRVRLIRREHAGVAAAGNATLDHARGTYLARHDADDIMAPDRLARQVAHLDSHPEVVACGSDYELFGGASGVVRMPRSPQLCRARLCIGTCVSLGATLMRAAALHRHGIRYRDGWVSAEDYLLISELSEVGDIVNLPFVGLRYRVHPRQITTAQRDRTRELNAEVAARNLARHGAGPIDPADLAPLIWPAGRGWRSAGHYLALRAPRLVALTTRAQGRAGALTAMQHVREQLNSAIRTQKVRHT